ncbi:MAG: hypothetical protein DRP64_16345, partial [Verrucomicrobia bacterium]
MNMKQFWLNLLVVPALLLAACAPDRRSDVPVASSTLGKPAPEHSSDEDVASTQLHIRDFGADPSSTNVRPALEAV